MARKRRAGTALAVVLASIGAVGVIAYAAKSAGPLQRRAWGTLRVDNGHGQVSAAGVPTQLGWSLAFNVSGVTPGAIIQVYSSWLPAGTIGQQQAPLVQGVATAGGTVSLPVTSAQYPGLQKGASFYVFAYDTAVAGYSNSVKVTMR